MVKQGGLPFRHKQATASSLDDAATQASFDAFIRYGKSLAKARMLEWDFPLETDGSSKSGWNLTELANGPPPNHFLRDLGFDDKALLVINERRNDETRPPLLKQPLSKAWQDLIKSSVCDNLFVHRYSTGHAVLQIFRPLKVLATCVYPLEPWQLNVDAIRSAVDIAKAIQASGRLADLILSLIRSLIDSNHLAEACPLYPALGIARAGWGRDLRSRAIKSKDELREDLAQRKRAERLPERKAFWELIRIIFTEKPRSYIDALRFAALKVMVLGGLRIGEAVLLPADWQRHRDYYDPKGRPAGELGGYSRALMLRHFAEKQQSENSDSVVMFETAQNVPEMFEEILTEALDEALRITQPLRETLKLQIESGRLLPWYSEQDLIPASTAYTHITGNPFWLDMPKEVADDFVVRYRKDFSPDVLDELSQYQNNLFEQAGRVAKFDMAFYMYFNRFINIGTQHHDLLKLRASGGEEYKAVRKKWGEVYLRVGELEAYLAAAAPTKLPDLSPLRLQNADLNAWELLFLMPKRSLSEERSNGISDLTRYYAISKPDPSFLSLAVGEEKDYRVSLFARYGTTEADRALTLMSHSLRHLKTAELFRLAVADTIISKHLNRNSVVSSYQYDHPSLAEELERIEIPEEIEAYLGHKATTVAKLIKAGKASGPIVEEFKKIQREAGDDTAFEYLRAEADGFHSTPYGHCINSFTVDPCPKNLECFAGCCHLTATNLTENRMHLETLERRFAVALSESQARPAGSTGRKNQIYHATVRLESIRKLLATPVGERVFPNGKDFSKQNNIRSVLDD